MANDVFVLGAGFSKAIHTDMPLLGGLGTEVLKRLGVSRPLHVPDRLDLGDFEGWLSVLADEQPWRTEAENLEARATYLKITGIMRTVLLERVRQARLAPCPDWLLRIVSRWHRDEAAVITLNYDPLVEAAFAEAARLAGGEWTNDTSHAQVYPKPMTPTASVRGAVFGATQVRTLKLLKLHGSLNWLYSGRSSFYGETIYDDSVIRSWAPAPSEEYGDAADKVPLIVPPTVGKSGFFENESVRAQWRSAFVALRGASQVFCLGYSLPQGDLLLKNLLTAGVSAGSQIAPVDISRDTFVRYETVFGANTTSAFIKDDEPIAHFVELYDGGVGVWDRSFPYRAS